MKIKTLLLYISILIVFSGCSGSSKQVTIATKAESDWPLVPFLKADSINPIIKSSPAQIFLCPVSNKEVKWEERNVLNPSVVVKDGRIYMIYRAQDMQMTSRLGLAVSDDGLHFTKQPEPVLYPDNDNMKQYEWKGGIEDPRVVETPDGKYIMTYTAYDGKVARLCIAISNDLQKWSKLGLVAGEGKYRDLWSKSGAIVSELTGNRIVARKINGKYWMYFGDTDLFIAFSDDLIHWTIAENSASKKMISVLHPRPGYFDSRLVEPGPFALVRDRGILLIYNGSNAANFNDPSLPKFTYAAGQALFDIDNPYKLIGRMDTNFIHPDKSYEKTGEVNEVCFVEGLARFKDKWFLYYGTADSKIAVAVLDNI